MLGLVEYLVRVRALGACAANGVQEVARLMIVNDINNITASFYADHQPILDIPPYDKPYTNNIVILMIKKHITRIKSHLY